MFGTADVSDMESAAVQAQVDAQAAADELGHASKLTDGIGYEDDDELEDVADELRDALQTAANSLEDALEELRRVL
jgi:hypothetical protein